MAEFLSVATIDAVRVLTFDRPERLNALDTAARLAIADHLAAAQRDDDIGAVVLTGAGERAFCAGQDLNESAALDAAEGARWMSSWKAYFAALSTFTKPLIAAINGVAAGAGFETVLLCDYGLAVPAARLIMAEVDIGLPCIVGGHLLEVHLGHSRAAELVLSGRAVPAEEARAIGLVQEIATPAALMERALAVAASLAAKPPVAMRLNLERFRALLRAGLAEAEDASVHYQAEAVATGEPQRVMAEFLARRARRRTG